MPQQDLQIRLKVEAMIQYAYAPLRNFPKSEKHVLSAEIRQSMFRLLRLVIVVQLGIQILHGGFLVIPPIDYDHEAQQPKHALDAELDLLRSLVRLAQELTFLPFRQYEIWARHLAEIGRMVGGWLNWAKAQA